MATCPRGRLGAWWLASSAVLCVSARCASALCAAEESATYRLQYRLQTGDVLRWQVEQRTNVRTTVGGVTQTVETDTRSVKVWRVVEVDAQGRAILENSVESVDLRQRLTGREETRYRSGEDQAPPPGFENFAQGIGVPLFRITLDAQGQVIAREQLQAAAQNQSGMLTIPLPATAVAVGHTWTSPHELAITLPSGEVKNVQMRQRYALESVSDGLAVISMETQVLSPSLPPEVQVQVVQHNLRGKVHFDIEAGRIVSQQMDVDEQAFGFSGEASNMRFVTRFTEALLPAAAQTARRAALGPPPQ